MKESSARSVIIYYFFLQVIGWIEGVGLYKLRESAFYSLH